MPLGQSHMDLYRVFFLVLGAFLVYVLASCQFDPSGQFAHHGESEF